MDVILDALGAVGFSSETHHEVVSQMMTQRDLHWSPDYRR